MQLFYLLVSCLVALASGNALPNSGSTTTTTTCSAMITAKYDDLPPRPPASVPAPIGTYRGLLYSINLLTLGVLGSPPLAGVIPASNPNVASFGFFSRLSTQNVTVLGGGAGYKTFNPSSIAYACVVTTEQSVVNVPASCTLSFSGYKAGKRVVRQLVTYEVATGQLTKAMSVARLQGFSGVDTIRFDIVVPQLTVAALIDNLVYTGCS